MLIKKQKSAVLIYGNPRDDLFALLKKRKLREVFVMEGRPGLQSGRECCRKLLRRKITPTVISDNMAGFLFAQKMLREVWLTYEDLGRDGVLCPIGSLILGVLGKRHGVAVSCYPASRKTSFLGTAKDILHFQGTRIAPQGIAVYVPLLEWIPKKYVRKIYD